MARFEKIGCFGLTEPLVGSGACGGLTATAKRDGDTWFLNGQKTQASSSMSGDRHALVASSVIAGGSLPT